MSTQDNQFPIQIRNKTTNILKKIESFAVIDEQSYGEACSFLTMSKELQEKIAEYWADDKKSSHATWRGICKKESDMLLRTREIDSLLNPKIGAYLKKLEDKRRTEEQRLENEKEATRKKLELQARQAEQKGQTRKVAIIQEKIAVIEETPTEVAPAFDKKLDLGSGKSVTTKPRDWEFKITDLALLLGGITTGKIPLEIINVTIAKIPAKNWVRDTGITSAPGLDIEEKFGVSIKT